MSLIQTMRGASAFRRAMRKKLKLKTKTPKEKVLEVELLLRNKF